jgi:ABC-type transporter Mla MlaB component
MDMYQHDSADTFRFVLKGKLAKIEAQQFQCALETAASILDGKDLIIEVSGITKVDAAGVELLTRMRESGAQIIAARVPKSQDLVPFLDKPLAVPRHDGPRLWALRVLKALRISGSDISPSRCWAWIARKGGLRPRITHPGLSDNND